MRHAGGRAPVKPLVDDAGLVNVVERRPEAVPSDARPAAADGSRPQPIPSGSSTQLLALLWGGGSPVKRLREPAER